MPKPKGRRNKEYDSDSDNEYETDQEKIKIGIEAMKERIKRHTEKLLAEGRYAGKDSIAESINEELDDLKVEIIKGQK